MSKICMITKVPHTQYDGELKESAILLKPLPAIRSLKLSKITDAADLMEQILRKGGSSYHFENGAIT